MAADSKYKTLSNIRLAIIKDAKETTSTQIVSLVDRWINEGYEKLSQRKKRKWLDQQFTVQVNAAVQNTCTVTNGSTTVTFTAGSTFPSGVELQFQNKGYEEVYDVASATLNVVKLNKPYLGDTNTAASGVVFQPSIILDSTVSEIFQVFHNHHAAPLSNCGPQEMRRLQEGGAVQLDFAANYTIFGAESGAQRLLIYPYPFEDYTLYIDANVIPELLSTSDDEPLIPMKYRQILYWYGMFKMWKYHRNQQEAVDAYAEFKSMMNEMDGEMPTTLDYPQISVARTMTKRMRSFTPLFDPRLRDS